MDGGIGPKARGFGGLQNGMQLINSQILTATSTAITFANIPQIYNHLKLIITTRLSNSATTVSLRIQFNGDTGSNYAYQYFLGAGSGSGAGFSASTTQGYIGDVPGATATANAFGCLECTISSYRGANHKQCLAAAGATSAAQPYWITTSTLWKSTSPISSLKLTDTAATANFQIGSEFYLYGIN